MAKNYSDASFFIEAGEIPRVKIRPEKYLARDGRQHVNAVLEIEAQGAGLSLKISLPLPGLKGLVAAAAEFLNEPGEPDLDLRPGTGGCWNGFAMN